MLYRIIIAIICVFLLFALLPPIFALIGFNPDANLILILRICIAGIAILYIIKGDKPLPS